MSSLLLMLFSVTIAASILFAGILILERILPTGSCGWLLPAMRLITVFYLAPALLLAKYLLSPITSYTLYAMNTDDFKWAVKSRTQLHNLPGFDKLISFILLVWALGVLIQFFRIFVRGNLYLRKLVSRCEPDSKLIDICQTQFSPDHTARKKLRLLKAKGIHSPFTAGIIHPKIIFPDTDFSEQDMYLALKHELIHIKNHDVLFKYAAAMVKCLNWFNPIVYLYCKNAYAFCEYRCDKEVVRFLDKEQRAQYARLIVSLAGQSAHDESILFLTNNKKEIEKRIYQIMAPSKNKHSKWAAVISAGLFILCPVTVYAATNGTIYLQDIIITVFENAAPKTDWQATPPESSISPAFTEDIRRTIPFSIQQGINKIDKNLAFDEQLQSSEIFLNKGQKIVISLMSDSSSDQFIGSIQNTLGENANYLSTSGGVCIIYTAPNSDDYLITIKNSRNSNIHLAGAVRIE